MKSYFRLYLLAFACSLLGSLSLGILALFSIFTQPLQRQLQYSQSAINKVIIAQTVGLNGFTPLCGLIADLKGTWILSLLALACYTMGFSLILLVYNNRILDPTPVYFSFFVIGCAHGSLLFSCLLNCARSMGKHYKTLAIGTPNLMVAFSTFLQIHVLKLYFDDPDPTIAFQKTLKFFLYSLSASSVFSMIGCMITDRTEKKELQVDHFSNFDASPLLSGAGVVLASPPGSPFSFRATEDLEYVQLDDQISVSSRTYQQKIVTFLTSPLMYPLIIAFFMSIGATEFFLTNLSTILSSLHQNTLDEKLQVYSISSTVARFAIMLLTDYVCMTFRISRLSIVSAVIILCGLGHFYLSCWPISTLHLNVIVVLNSILNSSLYTLFPAILASIYGLEILGTTYGIFSCSSIIGNLLLNLAYSADYTKNCLESSQDNLVICTTGGQNLIKTSSTTVSTMNVPNDDNDDNLCPVCGIDLSRETDLGREEHINSCLYNLEFSGSPDSKRHTNRMLVYTLESNTHVNEDNECVICFEEFNVGDKVGRLECLCCFHYKCIKDWINRKGACECPVHAVATET
ncbi:hypothetical protein OGAPHI_006313 [Ogataea philodendri]|uniref:RING-type E3 ubiquitin transferase n=1 Tax=Ogataea philodendri TaxID=1378263 RepID=A0A9P8NYX3_9ASCO|nr:uncharacterized protein OGAPHI_006313 [Ogataea philodendri]KAH3662132.1 hypothetical protein OGAPHI_006313 [Ogataea philodendri]